LGFFFPFVGAVFGGIISFAALAQNGGSCLLLPAPEGPCGLFPPSLLCPCAQARALLPCSLLWLRGCSASSV